MIKFLPLIGILLIICPISAHSLDSPGVQVDVLVKSTSSWDGARLPHYPAGQPEVTIAKVTIPPGAALPFHKHPVINAGYLLKGTLTVETVKGQVIHLKAGDPLVEVVDCSHRGINEGTEPAVIVVVYAGVVGTPITVQKTAESASPGSCAKARSE